MAISNRIKELTEIALKDKVLTFVERETIIKAGIEEGISKEELDEYINKALQEKINSQAKEDLDSCPQCGAQIPLISDTCPFCGFEYEKSKHKAPSNTENLTDEDAETIRRENAKTCPGCGHTFPLISNICPTCGHIMHEQRDSQLNIKNLVEGINDFIAEMKNNHKATFLEVLSHRKAVVMLYLGTLCLIFTSISIQYGATKLLEIFTVGTLVCFFLTFRWLKKSKTEDSPVEVEDNNFYKCLNMYEMYTRQVQSLYGNNQEAKDALAKFNDLISELKHNKKQNRIKLTILLLIITVVFSCSPLLLPSVKNNYEENKAKYEEYYKLVERKTTLTGYDLDFDSKIRPFIKSTSTADLHVDILSQQWYLTDTVLSKFKLRIDNVEIVSTGVANHQPDSLIPFGLLLWNKDHKLIGKDLPPIMLDMHGQDANSKDNVSGIMEKASGSCFVNFVTTDTISDIEAIKNILDSAYYYSILL